MDLCPIQLHATRSPKRTCIHLQDRKISYQELDQLIASSEKPPPGKIVSFPATPSLETIIKIFALLRCKAIACPLNPRFLENCDQIPSFLAQKDVATLLFTSGTSNTPKLACLSYENHYYNALGALELMPLMPEDIWLLSLPLYHVSGLAILFRCALAGASISLTDTIDYTHLSCVPTQLFRLLKNPPKHLLKCILVGGAPIAKDLLERAANLPIFPTYGMTEMASQISTKPFPGPLPHREILIAEDQEISVRGKTLFLGYLEKGEVHLPTNDGWFATRDLGKWIADGTLQWLGRKDHLFICGGENIQPEQIEDQLLRLPGIEEAIVVPISDPQWGAKPVCFLSGKYREEEIKERLKEKLSPLKIPTRFYPLPAAASLKRSRSSLAALAEELRESESAGLSLLKR